MPDYAFNKNESMLYRGGSRTGFFASMCLFASVFYFIFSKIAGTGFDKKVFLWVIASIAIVYWGLLLAKQTKNVLFREAKKEKLK